MSTRFLLVLAALVAVAPYRAAAGDVAADCSGFEDPELTEASPTKWYFSKKTYKTSKDPIYYAKIKF